MELSITFSTIGNAWRLIASNFHPFDESDRIMSEIQHVRGDHGNGMSSHERGWQHPRNHCSARRPARQSFEQGFVWRQ